MKCKKDLHSDATCSSAQHDIIINIIRRVVVSLHYVTESVFRLSGAGFTAFCCGLNDTPKHRKCSIVIRNAPLAPIRVAIVAATEFTFHEVRMNKQPPHWKTLLTVENAMMGLKTRRRKFSCIENHQRVSQLFQELNNCVARELSLVLF